MTAYPALTRLAPLGLAAVLLAGCSSSPAATSGSPSPSTSAAADGGASATVTLGETAQKELLLKGWGETKAEDQKILCDGVAAGGAAEVGAAIAKGAPGYVSPAVATAFVTERCKK